MARPRYLVVVAAGSGHRMGGDIPKQFLPLDGRVILQRTIDVFRQAVPGIKVVTVLASEWCPYWRDLCAQHRFFYPQVFVGGGLTRFHSVQNALAQPGVGSFAFRSGENGGRCDSLPSRGRHAALFADAGWHTPF